MARVFAITDASTRLITNPGFESWANYAGTAMPDNWTQYSTPTVLVEQSVSNVIEGVYAAKMSYVGVTGVIGMYQEVTASELVEGVTYYIVATVYVEAGSCSLTVWDGGGTSNAVTASSSGTGLQRLIVQKAAPSTGFRIGLTVSANGDVVYWNLVQLGTAYIEFIEGVQDTTFRITNWEQRPADLKGGGVWRESAISNGRTIVDGYWENAIEDITFHVRGSTSQDVVGTKIQDLFRLLNKARTFSSTEWQTDPVYMVTKASTETNFRFALIKKGVLPTIPDPFFIDFAQLVLRDVPMQVEHEIYTALPPGETLGVLVSAVETYNSRTLGNVNSSGTRTPTAANEVYVGNQRKVANITHIYNYDDSAGTYSSNLMDSALPFTLFPSSPAVGDKVIVGISTAVTDSGPFCNIVWDIATAASATTSYTITYKYWNGSSLATLTVKDNTSSFSVTGVNAVHWQQLASGTTGWTARSLNGVTALWIEIELTALSGTLTRPTQQNRKPYTISWPYIEVQATAVKGDIEALARLMLKDAYETSDVGSRINHLVCGVRSKSRGSNFTAYLNASDEQNPSGISVSLNINGGTEAAFESSNLAPTGRRVLVTSTGVSSTWRVQVRWTFTSAIANEYIGRYRAFVRCAQINAVGAAYGDFSLAMFYSDSVTISSPTIVKFNSPYVFGGFPISTDPPQLVDMGEIIVPHAPVRNKHAKGTFYLNLAIQNTNAGSSRTLAIYDAAVIPIDEWSGSFYDPIRFSSIGFGAVGSPPYHMDIQSTSSETIAQVLNSSDDTIVHPGYTINQNGRPIVQSNSAQRLWFLFNANVRDTSLGLQSASCSPFFASKVQLQVNEQYLNMRGNR